MGRASDRAHLELEQLRFRPNNRGQNTARQSHYFNSYHEPALSGESLRLNALAQLGRQVPVADTARIAGYYNAQCCGFSAEYSSSISASTPVPASSRTRGFHFSVTLGGIGNVSNIFGGLGGANKSVGRGSASRAELF